MDGIEQSLSRHAWRVIRLEEHRDAIGGATVMSPGDMRSVYASLTITWPQTTTHVSPPAVAATSAPLSDAVVTRFPATRAGRYASSAGATCGISGVAVGPGERVGRVVGEGVGVGAGVGGGTLIEGLSHGDGRQPVSDAPGVEVTSARLADGPIVADVDGEATGAGDAWGAMQPATSTAASIGGRMTRVAVDPVLHTSANGGSPLTTGGLVVAGFA